MQGWWSLFPYTVDPGQHGFELCGSTYMQIFPPNKYTVGPSIYPGVESMDSTNLGSKTVVWKSVDADG